MSEDLTAPDGYEWQYIGTCSCRGADGDHTNNDHEWRLVPVNSNPERDGNGCMIYKTPEGGGR